MNCGNFVVVNGLTEEMNAVKNVESHETLQIKTYSNRVILSTSQT